MNLRSTTPNERLVIYLNDHHAMATAELDMAERCRASNVGTELANDLTQHIGQVSSDRQLLEELIDAVGGSVDRFKVVSARVAERLGRLKLNGQLRGYSPLSRVVELEALLTSARSRQALWTVLDVTQPPIVLSEQIEDRATVTGEQVEAIEQHLRLAAATAFDPERSSPA